MAAPDERDNDRKAASNRGNESRPQRPQGRAGFEKRGPRQGGQEGGDKTFVKRERREGEPEKEPKNLIYGARTVMEAMEAGRQIDKVLIKKGLDSELRNDVYEKARELHVPIQIVPAAIGDGAIV